MKKALIEKAAKIRQNAAELLERTERLLADLREITDITTPPKAEEYIPKKHGRIILHIR